MIFTCKSPCKLNLFLYINRKRPDNYHDLQTLFTLLDFGDDMTFIPNDSNEITIEGNFNFKTSDNLIYKAAMALKENYKDKLLGQNTGCHIKVYKKIPTGGGLGGGSSNAATTLLVLNKLFGINAKEQELCALGAKLGADVPIFIFGKSAFAEGIGDALQEVTLPTRYYLVYTPNCHVSTKDVFALKDLKRDSPVRSFAELMSLGYHNDFTDTVIKNYCDVGHALSRLVKYGIAYMSGSGASCFVEFVDKNDAYNALEDLKASGITSAFVATNLQRSSVHTALCAL